MDILDQVEGPGGSATNANTAEELANAISVLGASQGLSPAGSDTIQGGDGNDLIFGDAPFTDTLANQVGLSATADGSGWGVFQQLEAGQGTPGALDPAGDGSTWTRADTIDYIATHQSELAQESGRSGGNDTIDGGAGNDIIYGQEGNDIIIGGSGDDFISGGSGSDTMTGGSGTDTFVIGSDSGIGGIKDFITDYSGTGGDGDAIDLTHLLSGLPAGANPAGEGYVHLVQDGSNVDVQVDANGGGNSFQTVAVLENYNFNSGTEAVKILYNDTDGTHSQVINHNNAVIV